MFKQVFIVFIIVLIILAIGSAFTRVMEHWDRRIESKYEQPRSTIGLPQGVAIEIGRIDLNTVARTITLYLHIKSEDKYYYTELTLPTREVKASGTD